MRNLPPFDFFTTIPGDILLCLQTNVAYDIHVGQEYVVDYVYNEAISFCEYTWNYKILNDVDPPHIKFVNKKYLTDKEIFHVKMTGELP